MKAGILMLALLAVAFAATPATDVSSQPVRLYYGTVGSNDYVLSTTAPDNATDAWAKHSDMPQALMDNCAAGNATHTYALSGYNTSNPMYLFRHATGSAIWQTMAAPPMEISNGGCAIIGDTLYYCSGYSYGPVATVDTLLKYSISGDNWTSAPGPFTGTTYNWQPLILACAGKLYYISGCNQPGASSPTTDVWCYTPGAGWAQVASMNQGRVFAAGWTYHDTIWVSGGYQNTTILNHTEFYDPVANVWTVNVSKFPVQPVGTWGAGSGVCGSTGWVAGGVNAAMALQDTIMYFDHVAQTWSIGVGLFTKVYRTAGCGSADGKAILYGGSTGGFTPITTCQYEQLSTGNANDVGATAVLSPGTPIPPGTVTPKAMIKNFGTVSQSGFPVTCWIDSGATRVYNQSATYSGSLAPGATDSIPFLNWTTGQNGTYSVTMFTDLTGDQDRSNDTIRKTVNVISSNWTPITPLPDSPDRVTHSVLYDPGTDRVYMIGGNAEGQPATYLGMCQYYDPVAGTWSNKAVMTTPRGWCGAGVIKGKIYMVGGHDNAGGFPTTNEEYDITGNAWATKTVRPRAGAAPTAVAWRDTLLYVMGGTTGTTGLTNVDIYDPANNAWTVGTALPVGTFMGSGAVIGDTIYSAQGYSGTACWPNLYKGYINPADPTQIAWTAGPVLTEPIFNGATVALSHKVYWIGGFISAATVTNHVWVYDQTTGAITRFSPDYPVSLSRWTFAAARPTADGGGEIYCMAGDRNGDWAVPNQDYYKIQIIETGVSEQPGWQKLGWTLDGVVPSIVRDGSRLSYTLGKSAGVNLSIYDASGSLVRTLVNGTVAPGTKSVTWNRAGNDGRRVAAGTYFYRLVVDGKSVSAKAILLD